MKSPQEFSSPSSTSSSRTVKFTLILIVLSVIFVLGSAELMLRVRNPFGFRMRGNTLVLPANKVYDIHATAEARTDQLEAHVIHTKNSLGFRGPEPLPDFANQLTLVAVGGSTTECFFLSDGKTWPERLSARLQPEFNDLWVNNAGLDGQTTFGHLQLTRQVLVKMHPKVVLYLAALNDMFTDEPRGFDKMVQNQWAALADHSELAATLLNFYRWSGTQKIEDLGAMPKPLALRDRPIHPISTVVADLVWDGQDRRIEEFRARLTALVELNRENGIEPVFITQPTLLGDIDLRTGIDTRPMKVELWTKLDGALTWRILERYNDVTRQVGRDHQVLVVDLARAMPKDSTYFYDFFHFTNEGADKVASIVHDALVPWLATDYQSFLASGDQ